MKHQNAISMIFMSKQALYSDELVLNQKCGCDELFN